MSFGTVEQPAVRSGLDLVRQSIADLEATGEISDTVVSLLARHLVNALTAGDTEALEAAGDALSQLETVFGRAAPVRRATGGDVATFKPVCVHWRPCKRLGPASCSHPPR